MLVRFPEVNTSAVATTKSSFLSEATYGFTYLIALPGLLGLVLFSASSFYIVGGINVITIPLVLNFVSVSFLGTILSLFGIAM